MQVSRRGLITGLTAFLAAPAIVRASSLMPVKAWADGVALYSVPHPVCDLLAGEPLFVGDMLYMDRGRYFRMRADLAREKVPVGISTVTCSEGAILNDRVMSFCETLNIRQGMGDERP